MSTTDYNTAATTPNVRDDRRVDLERRISSETKPSFKTTELIAYVVAVVGVLIASAVTDASDFGAQEAWRYITYLTIGYMIARGLAKSGARNFFDENDGNGSR
jgi:hypothetical protein